jgi:hypothetical protein
VPRFLPPVTVTPTPHPPMKRASILPIILPALLAACGESDRSAASEGDFQGRGAAVEQEQAIVTMDAAAPGEAPPVVPTTPGAPPRVDLPTQISAADTGGVVPPVPGTPSVSLNPMLIRTGTATIQVDSLEAGIAQLRALAGRLGGLVGNTAITSGTDEARRATVELRIPSASFDRAVSGLAPIGRVEAVNVTAEDVGEEYTDVTARVANARRLESRLLDLLERRTGRLEEVLNIERELARVREEIERYEGRLRYLRTRASISVLTITLHEPGTVLGRPGERPIRDAFGQAWRNLVGLIAGLIAASGVLIPLALLGYLLWRAFRWMRRRDRDAAYRETLRRERERDRTPPPEEPALRG